MRRALQMLLLALLAASLSGCAALGLRSTVKLDNAARLVARPDFQAARTAAPEWARDALRTINQLEYQIERR